ncbi:MAG: hypothetical protein LBM99_02900 [Bacillales bacterium]|jgi:hypothetical protein|nr:hypothetical protein [Bacillales bacterium]
MKENFESLIIKIKEKQDIKFETIYGEVFSYEVVNDNLIVFSNSVINQQISLVQLKQAYSQWPVESPNNFNRNIVGAVYLYTLYKELLPISLI